MSEELIPEPASLRRRAMAWAFDSAVVAVPAAMLVAAGVATTWQRFEADMVGRTGLTVFDLLRGHGLKLAGVHDDRFWVVLPLAGALLVVPLIQFLYQSVLLSWRGRTLGSVLVDTRVGTDTEPMSLLSRRARRRAFLTVLVESGLLCFALAIVVIGGAGAGRLLVAAAVVVFWLDRLPLVGPRRRSLVDYLTGTVVVRTSHYADIAAKTTVLARRLTGSPAPPVAGGSEAEVRPALAAPDALSSDVVLAPPDGQAVPGVGQPVVGQPAPTQSTAAQAAAAAARRTADAAAVAGQLAREGADSIARSAAFQQAINSRAAQRAQDLGSRASGSARRLGGRAQEIWAERQSRRADQAGEHSPGVDRPDVDRPGADQPGEDPQR
ncbi:RDD family protein [Actinoplanes sp. KI2]|uniref:RDD family protein n=1 Tax=Actinoplanes sp. KI2 TaxID=2983315 RepID=UPI0021D5AE94|nr:RDD family protein [Actinoplanes sp. KI2]MCU7722598.1 RDD family protein [Actinoplanes sp. KI2]